MIKTILKRMLLALGLGATLLGTTACSDDEPTTNYIEIKVQLTASSAIGGDAVLAGRQVTLTNSEGKTATVTSTATGLATFSGIIPGQYTISTTWTLTGAEYTKVTGTAVGATNYTYSGTIPETLYSSSNTTNLTVTAAPQSELVISKVYYSQGKDNNNKNYSAGIYVEIFNNSDNPINLDGYYLGLNESSSTAPTALLALKESNLYMKQVYKFPSQTLAAGTALVIANVAIDHTTVASLESDLSHADLEIVDPTNKVANQSAVTDMPQVFSNLTMNMNLTLSGPVGLALFKSTTDPATFAQVDKDNTSTGATKFLTIPTSTVVDGVDILNYKTTGIDASQKRYPAFIDAGYTYVTAIRNHLAVARRISSKTSSRAYLQDSNNSKNDFVQIKSLAPKTFDYMTRVTPY